MTVGEQNHYIYEFGPFRLDAQKRLLRREGEIVPLKPKAFDTLLALVERGGHVLEKDELMRRVWPDTVVEEGNLTFNISSLRKALGDDPRRHEYIVTIPGEGYQFVAGVRATFDELVVHESTTITVEEEEEVDTTLADVRGEESILPAIAEAGRPSEHLALNQPSTLRHPHPYRPVIAALFIVGAATVFGLYLLINQRQPKERAAGVPFHAMSISRLTTSGRIKHAAISPDGKYVAQITEDAAGDSLWVSHVAAPASVRIAGPTATEYVSVTFAPDGGSVYYVALERDKGRTTLYRAPVLGGPSSVAADDTGPIGFSPDGRQIAFIRTYPEESRLILANSDGTNEQTLATRQLPEFFRVDWNAPAWSPDDRTIACQVKLNDERGQYETIVGVSVKDGSVSPLTSERWNHTEQPAWLADGSGLLLTASENALAPEQVWHIRLQDGTATQITHDLNDYHDLSLTADASRLAAVQDNSTSSIWVAPDADASRARQINSEAGMIQELAWTPDGRIVYRSNAGGNAEIWVMNADGSNPTQLTVDAHVHPGLSVSPDGRYIFFSSDRTGHFNIWRVDMDGDNFKQLTFSDGELFPQCTPDGAWVVYQRSEAESRLWKVPAEGGEPVQLTETPAKRPAVSPDGSLIAYHYLDGTLNRWGIGIISSAGGARLERFDFPPTVAWRFVRWSPDGQSIAYTNSPSGLSDIWLQPLDDGPPKQLTNFKGEKIMAFDWSPDKRSLALVRRVETSDVVLIEQRQK